MSRGPWLAHGFGEIGLGPIGRLGGRIGLPGRLAHGFGETGRGPIGRPEGRIGLPGRLAHGFGETGLELAGLLTGEMGVGLAGRLAHGFISSNESNFTVMALGSGPTWVPFVKLVSQDTPTSGGELLGSGGRIGVPGLEEGVLVGVGISKLSIPS